MNTNWFDQLLGAADEWQQPWASVEPDPAGDGEGGGGDEGGDGAPLGPAGEKALQEERVLRKSLERDLGDLRAQMEQMKGLVDPKVYAQAQAQAQALKQQLDEKERLSADERQRLEAKANERVIKAEARATKAENDRIALQVKTAAQGLFLATEGRDGGDGSGLTYFDAWFAFHGSRHIRVDPATGKHYIVDSDGDPVKDGEQNIDPVKWLNEQADRSAVIGNFFKPKGGSGGGGLQGARGVRGVQSRSVEAARATSGGAFLSEHYGN
jgi:hypothetical protein